MASKEVYNGNDFGNDQDDSFNEAMAAMEKRQSRKASNLPSRKIKTNKKK